MRGFLFQVLAGMLGVFLAAEFLPGVTFVGPRKFFLLIGLVFGILNYFVKPVVNFFLFPLRLLTFGLIGLVINIGIVWFTSKILFPDYFIISGIYPLFGATIIIWLTSLFFYILAKRNLRQERFYD
jgi:putative membrane protein